MMHPAVRPGATAAITGGAKGIGFALALRLLNEGMNLAVLDSDADALSEAEFAFARAATQGQKIVIINGSATDQGIQQSMLVKATELGEIGLVVNNAAVLKGAGPWDNVGQWRTTIALNFWSVLELQSLFVPVMLQQERPSAVVNLGSKEGITTPPGNAAYNVSKAALRVLTEQLAHELREMPGSKVSAHLLIPGYTSTPMNFPSGLGDGKKAASAWTADQVVDFFLKRLAEDRFYIFCGDHEVTRTLDERRLQWSADDMILNRPALSRWHSGYKDAYAAYIEGAMSLPDQSPNAYKV